MAEETLRLVLDTYVVGRFSRIRRGLKVPAGKHLIVGMGSRVTGSILAQGDVVLAQDVHVAGSVRTALDVVIGARARVEGDVVSAANVYVLDGARVGGRLEAGGLVRIVGGFVHGPVRTSGDIEVGGTAVLHELRAGGRIRALPDFAPVGAREEDPKVTDS